MRTDARRHGRGLERRTERRAAGHARRQAAPSGDGRRDEIRTQVGRRVRRARGIHTDDPEGGRRVPVGRARAAALLARHGRRGREEGAALCAKKLSAPSNK